MNQAQTAIREDMRQAIFRTVGRAYAIMHADLLAADGSMRRALSASGQAESAPAIAEAFQSRARAIADSRIAGILSRSSA